MLRHLLLPFCLLSLFLSSLTPVCGDEGVEEFYTEDDHVIQLDKDNFEGLVTLSKDAIWLVEFYAPWCGHCKGLVNEWKRTAKVLRGLAYVGAVDATTNEALASAYGATSYPTIKIFSEGNKKGVTFEGTRTSEAFGSAALKEIRTTVKKRLGIKKKKGKNSIPDKVVKLSDSNFDDQVLTSEDFWFVEFYAPWCGHCKNLAPIWKQAAARLDGLCKFGAVDATREKALAAKYEIRGYPTIKYFPAGEKTIDYAYTGPRGLDDLLKFAAEKGEFSIPAPQADTNDHIDDVVKLTTSAFKTTVLDSQDVWFVEFFAPWCGHCKNLEPHWKAAAKTLKGKAKFGAVDCTVETDLAQKYNVTGYPTLKSFKKGKAKAFESGGTASDIVKMVEVVLKGEDEQEGPTNVITLTKENYAELVEKSDDVWMIDFYAPWCAHCKTLAPEFAQTSLNLEGKVKFGKVDCTTEESIKEKYEIPGYPTVFYFGKDKGPKPEDYVGTRSAGAMTEFALEKYNIEMMEPMPVTQLTNAEVFNEHCSKSMCMIAILPHILDTGASGREVYLDSLRVQASLFKAKGYGYLWAEAITQPSIEGAFNIGGAGYPALVMYNEKKERYAPFFGGFGTEAVTDFVNRLHDGKERTVKMSGKQLIQIATIDAWDGKDGELPREDL